MTRKLWKWLVASAVLMAWLPVQAQMWQRPMPQQRRADDERAAPPRQDAAQRELPSRQEFRPPQPMSADERRQLRRDIHEAGREIYRRNPPRAQD